jgi:hypothetical protein
MVPGAVIGCPIAAGRPPRAVPVRPAPRGVLPLDCVRRTAAGSRPAIPASRPGGDRQGPRNRIRRGTRAGCEKCPLAGPTVVDRRSCRHARRAGDVHPLWAVADLVRQPPQRHERMHRRVVGVSEGREDHPADQRCAGHAQAAAVPPAVCSHPIERQQQRHDRTNAGDQQHEPDAQAAPAAARRESASRPKGFDGQHREVDERNQQSGEVDRFHGQGSISPVAGGARHGSFKHGLA